MSAVSEARKRLIQVPTKRSLDRYGLTPEEWCQLLADQNWKCAICEKSKGRWNTDHQHVPGWSKLPAEERKTFVRGILCWLCNKNNAPSNLTARDARNLWLYLKAYEERRKNANSRSR